MFVEQIVDRCIIVLFNRYISANRPPHVQCQGYRRTRYNEDNTVASSSYLGSSGIIADCSNPHVKIIKSQVWADLLTEIGKGGDKIFTNLLVNCAMFMPIAEDQSRLRQFNGW